MVAPLAAVAVMIKRRLILKLISIALVFVVFVAVGLFALMLALVGLSVSSAEMDRHEEEQASAQGAGPWGGHSNGRIPPDQLCPLSWAEGQRMRCDAAEDLAELNDSYQEQFDTNIPIGYSYRLYEEQERIFLERFDPQPAQVVVGPFNDVQMYNGVRYVRMRGSSAAVPGTSNHGWGLAIDLSGEAYFFDTAENDWLMDNSSEQSWIHPEWAKKGSNRAEAWHFEYVGFDSDVVGGGEGGSTEGALIIEVAKTALGTPYVFGGGDHDGPSGGGFDCSGLLQWAVYQASDHTVVLPRTAKAQGESGQMVTEGTGSGIDMDLLEPGDAIAMKNSNRVGTGPRDFDHIGLYIGDGTMIHAPRPGKSVEIVNLDTNYYQSAFWSVRRLV